VVLQDILISSLVKFLDGKDATQFLTVKLLAVLLSPTTEVVSTVRLVEAIHLKLLMSWFELSTCESRKDGALHIVVFDCPKTSTCSLLNRRK
jgi:hypothetical protein